MVTTTTTEPISSAIAAKALEAMLTTINARFTPTARYQRETADGIVCASATFQVFGDGLTADDRARLECIIEGCTARRERLGFGAPVTMAQRFAGGVGTVTLRMGDWS